MTEKYILGGQEVRLPVYMALMGPDAKAGDGMSREIL